MRYLLFLVLFISAVVHGRDMSEVAHDIALVEAPSEFKEFKKKAVSQYGTWSGDNPSGSTKIFLDDRLLQIIPAIKSRGKDKNKDIKTMKDLVFWLAMYVELSEPPPSYILKAAPTLVAKFDAIRVKFSWEGATTFSKDMLDDYEKELKEQGKKLAEKVFSP